MLHSYELPPEPLSQPFIWNSFLSIFGWWFSFFDHTLLLLCHIFSFLSCSTFVTWFLAIEEKSKPTATPPDLSADPCLCVSDTIKPPPPQPPPPPFPCLLMWSLLVNEVFCHAEVCGVINWQRLLISAPPPPPPSSPYWLTFFHSVVSSRM